MPKLEKQALELIKKGKIELVLKEVFEFISTRPFSKDILAELEKAKKQIIRQLEKKLTNLYLHFQKFLYFEKEYHYRINGEKYVLPFSTVREYVLNNFFPKNMKKEMLFSHLVNNYIFRLKLKGAKKNVILPNIFLFLGRGYMNVFIYGTLTSMLYVAVHNLLRKKGVKIQERERIAKAVSADIMGRHRTYKNYLVLSAFTKKGKIFPFIPKEKKAFHFNFLAKKSSKKGYFVSYLGKPHYLYFGDVKDKASYDTSVRIQLPKEKRNPFVMAKEETEKASVTTKEKFVEWYIKESEFWKFVKRIAEVLGIEITSPSETIEKIVERLSEKPLTKREVRRLFPGFSESKKMREKITYSLMMDLREGFEELTKIAERKYKGI